MFTHIKTQFFLNLGAANAGATGAVPRTAAAAAAPAPGRGAAEAATNISSGKHEQH